MPLVGYETNLSRLTTLKVGDVMSHDVAVIPCTASMHQAAHVLDTHHATGAPVVDEQQRCIGILSAADFVCFEIYRTGDEPAAHARGENSPPRGEYLPWNSVRRFMSTAVQTVGCDTPLLRAAEIMCVEHIHRLVALNERGVPIGIITTLDIVAALTHVADEEHRQREPAVVGGPSHEQVRKRADRGAD